MAAFEVFTEGSREMPVTYELDQESSFIHTRCTGDVTLEEVLGHFHELDTIELPPARLNVLLDLSEMQSLPGSDQLKSVASEINRLQPKMKWAPARSSPTVTLCSG